MMLILIEFLLIDRVHGGSTNLSQNITESVWTHKVSIGANDITGNLEILTKDLLLIGNFSSDDTLHLVHDLMPSISGVFPEVQVLELSIRELVELYELDVLVW